MADIQASTGIDTRPFIKGLDATLRAARTWKRNIERTMNFDGLKTLQTQVNRLQRELSKSTRAPKVFEPLARAPRTARDIDVLTEAVRRNATQVRNLELAYGRGEVTQVSFMRQMSTLRGVAEGLASGLDQDSRALTTLGLSMQRADRSMERANRQMDESVIAAEKYRKASQGLRNAIEGRGISEAEGAELASKWAQEAREAAAQTEQWSDEYNTLMLGAARLERTAATLEGRITKLGLSKNVAIANAERLRSSWLGLQNILAVLAGGAGFSRMIAFTDQAARSSAEAANEVAMFFNILEGRGMSAAEGQRMLSLLAREFKETEESIAGSAATLVRQGFTLEQITTLFQRAGASAIAAGREAGRGFEAMGDAVASMNSARLNAIGIAGNISTWLQQEARLLGTTADMLSEEARARAIVNGVMSETGEEYENLQTLLSGFVGVQSEAAAVADRFNRSLGTGFAVVLAPLIRGWTALQSIFLSLPTALQTLIGMLTAMSVIAGAVAAGYLLLNTEMVRTQVIGGGMQALLNTEMVLRSRLGGVLLTLAARYRLLTAEQIANATAARATAQANAANAASMINLGNIFTRVGAFLRNLPRLIARIAFSPITIALGVVIGLFQLWQTMTERFPQIFEPAFRAFRTALEALRNAFQPVVDGVRQLFSETGLLGRLWRTVLISLSALVSRQILKLSFHVERAAIAFNYLRRIMTGDWSGAWTDAQEELANLEVRTAAAYAEIDEMVDAARRGEDALEDMGDSAERAAQQLADAEEVLADLNKRLDGIELDLTGTDLDQQLAGIREQFQELYDDLEAIAAQEEDNPFMAGLADQLRERIGELEGLARDRAIHAAVQRFEDEVAQGHIDAMEAGTARINAEYDRRIEQTRAAYADLLSSLEAGTAAYSRVLELSNTRIAQLEEARARDLAAATEAQLAQARAFTRQVKQIEQDLARTEISFIQDVAARTAAEFDQAAAEVSARYAQMIEDITGKDEDAAAQRAQLQELLTRELIQLERQRTVEMERINRERHEASLQAAARARDLELQLAQATARTAADVAALELERRLADIAENERQQIQQAAETGASLVDIEREANLQRQIARQAHADAILDIEQRTADRVRRLQQETTQIMSDLSIQQLQLDGQDRAAIEQQYEVQVRAALTAFDEIRNAKESSNTEIMAAEQRLNAALERAAFDRAKAMADLDIQGVQQRLQAIQQAFNRGIIDRNNVDDLRAAIRDVEGLRGELEALAGSQAALASLDQVLQGLNDELADLTGYAPNLERAASILSSLDAADLDARRAEIEMLDDVTERLHARYALEAELRDRELADLEASIGERVHNEQLAARLIREARDSNRQAHLIAEQQLTRDLEVEAQRRAKVTADALQRAGTDLQRARISLMRGEVDRLRAMFELERAERAAQQEQQLREFEGSQEERRQLMRQHQQLELALLEAHNRELAQVQDQALTEYADSVRAAYRTASQAVDGEAARINKEIMGNLSRLNERGLELLRAGLQDQISELREAGVADEALEPFLDAMQAADEAARTFRERDLLARADSIRITREYTAALAAETNTRRQQTQLFNRQLQQLNAEVSLVTRAAAAARQRGAAEAELTPILERQASLQREAVQGIHDQIRALQEQRAEQLRLTETGQDVIDYYRTLAELTGQAESSRVQRELRQGLEMQRDLLVEQLNTAVAQKAPLEDRIKLAQRLAELEEQIAEVGGRAVARTDLVDVMDDARKELERFPTEAERATLEIGRLDAEIQDLNGQLQETLQLLGDVTAELSDAASAFTGTGPDIDTTGLINDFKAALEPLLAAAADELADAAGTAFTDTFTTAIDDAGGLAGAGLMTAFAAGIRANEAELLSAVDSILQKVRDRLPGSDARTGPLSGITASGRAFLPTFVSGIRKGVPGLNRFMDRALNGLLPNARGLSQRVMPNFAGAGGPTHIYYQGQEAPAGLAISARRFVQDVEREARIRKLVR